MDLKSLEREIEKTGFVLEARIAETLVRHSWTVIHGRYYIDDVIGSIREIDLLAYKVHRVDSVLYYTTLIISCKKSGRNIWALLTKDRNDDDPNTNWDPLQVWSNDKVLSFILAENWKNEYLKTPKEEENLSVPYECRC